MDVVTFYLIAFVLLGAMLFPTVRKFMGGGATVSAVRQWSGEHGFIVDTSAQAPSFPFVDYQGKLSATGTLKEHRLTVGVGIGGFTSRPVPVTFFQATLPRPVPGEVLIRTTEALWMGEMKHVELESTMFRNFLMVFASPAKLSTTMMSTDFMDWYQNQHQRPVIYAKGDGLCMMFQSYLTNAQVEAFSHQVPKIIAFVTKSGALEQKT